ncbi:hypothetical protein HDN1F_02330 [gamma proteobacterium HdN1]|nr:hypothetical protein HDN1F_02330 [gamma proteobacterium HdN1]
MTPSVPLVPDFLREAGSGTTSVMEDVNVRGENGEVIPVVDRTGHWVGLTDNFPVSQAGPKGVTGAFGEQGPHEPQGLISAPSLPAEAICRSEARKANAPSACGILPAATAH